MASGASAADVRSILSFAGAGTSASSTTNGANPQPTASSSKLPLSQPLSATPSLQNVTTIAGNVTATRKAKPEGISRELYALIGSGIPTMNARLAAKPKFKQKPKLADGRVSRWEWRPFENKARKDGFKLAHWAKANSDPNKEYPFAQYNVPAQTYTYTDEEYEKLLQDPDWTKDETDYLFSLVQDYDVRFYIVADRYDYKAPKLPNQVTNERVAAAADGSSENKDEGVTVKTEGVTPEKMDIDGVVKTNGVNGNQEGVPTTAKESGGGESEEVKTRTIEDLKDRYYTVCRRLIRSRPTDDENARSQLLSSYNYVKEIEITRKKYIESLTKRSEHEIAEEEALFIEIKRLEQDERRFARSREELLRVFAGAESGLPSVAVEDEAGAAILGDGKNKKKKGATGAGGSAGGMEVESPVSAQGVISLGPPQTPTKKTPGLVHDAAYDAKHCIHRLDTTSTTKAAHQAIHIRTWKIPQPKSTLAPRIAQILSELGISSQKLVMPTRENVQMMDQLMQAATALAETKKQVDRADQEIRVARKVLGMEEEEEAEESVVGRGKGKSKGKGKKVGGGGREEEGEGGGGVEEEEGGEGDAEGDVDGDGDAEGEDVDAEGERATSVATSVRSMSRKKHKRSASISSVETSTTNATRAPRKRQKN